MSDNPNPGFGPESWSLYGVGAGIVLLRLYARIRRLGFSGLQVDDYLVTFGFAWYTLLVVAFNEMLKGAGSNLLTPEDIEALTPQTIAERIRGSKWVFVSEHAMLLTIWSMKAAMLALYARITQGSNVWQRRVLKAVCIWVCCAFIGDMLALFLICRPINQYWAVPAENPQCSTYEYYQIVNAIFNISTDILILGIGIPPILKLRLSLQQKIVLVIVFGMGAFVIVAAILRGIYCLVPSLISYVYMNWYFREASVAVYVTNLPPIWALLREMFPNFISRFGSGANRSKSHAKNGFSNGRYGSGYGQNSDHAWGHKRDRSEAEEKGFDFDLDTYPISKTTITATEHELSDKDPRRNESSAGDSASTASSKFISKHEIRQDVTFTVEHMPAEGPGSGKNSMGHY